MAFVTFKEPCCIVRQAELQAVFSSDRIRLSEGCKINFSGSVLLEGDVSFAGDCDIRDGSRIETGSILTNVQLGIGNHVRPYSILTNVEAGARNIFGPFCFIRDGCVVGDDCILGAHMEAARARFGTGVKISHRAFIGDADIGNGTIIGAGVVFCNWDGQGRQATEVGSGAIIGSGSMLVPPLRIGKAAIIAAGSVVTKNIPPNGKLIQKRT